MKKTKNEFFSFILEAGRRVNPQNIMLLVRTMYMNQIMPEAQ
jgi:hypothetical protein